MRPAAVTGRRPPGWASRPPRPSRARAARRRGAPPRRSRARLRCDPHPTMSGGREAQRRLAALEDEQPALEGGLLDGVGRLVVWNSTPSMRPATDVADALVPAAALLESGAEPGAHASPRSPSAQHSISFSVARPAAAQTGLPANVEPWAPAGHVHTDSRAMNAPDRHARRDALGGGDDVRLDAGLLDRPPRAGATHARLDLVGDQQDAVLVADARAAPRRKPAGAGSSRPRPGSARPRSPPRRSARSGARGCSAQDLELGAAVAAGALVARRGRGGTGRGGPSAAAARSRPAASPSSWSGTARPSCGRGSRPRRR